MKDCHRLRVKSIEKNSDNIRAIAVHCNGFFVFITAYMTLRQHIDRCFMDISMSIGYFTKILTFLKNYVIIIKSSMSF